MFVPWALGLFGLIPFWASALALLTGHTFGMSHADISLALAAYGATIASFLGGMRWGLAINETSKLGSWSDYIISVVPQLLAWAALALSDRPRLVALALLIVVTGPLDLHLVRRGVAPVWFGPLRMTLSLLAGAGLLVAAAA